VKLEIKNDMIVATATSTQECIDLVALAKSYKEVKKEVKPRKKYKTKTKSTCEYCGKKYSKTYLYSHKKTCNSTGYLPIAVTDSTLR